MIPLPPAKTFGGIVLCGGMSSRMGLPKAWLPFGDETMLQRVVRQLKAAVDPVVVVAASGQPLPPLPPDVTVVRDRQPQCGPLEGLLAGLSALQGRVDAAYLSGCDAPFLSPAFVQRVCERLADYEIAVPLFEGRYHPLAAAYRTTLVPRIELLRATNSFRMFDLVETSRARELSLDDFRDVDPQGDSLANVNHPLDFGWALAKAGICEPSENKKTHPSQHFDLDSEEVERY